MTSLHTMLGITFSAAGLSLAMYCESLPGLFFCRTVSLCVVACCCRHNVPFLYIPTRCTLPRKSPCQLLKAFSVTLQQDVHNLGVHNLGDHSDLRTRNYPVVAMANTGESQTEADCAHAKVRFSASISSRSTQPVPKEYFIYRRGDITPNLSCEY